MYRPIYSWPKAKLGKWDGGNYNLISLFCLTRLNWCFLQSYTRYPCKLSSEIKTVYFISLIWKLMDPNRLWLCPLLMGAFMLVTVKATWILLDQYNARLGEWYQIPWRELRASSHHLLINRRRESKKMRMRLRRKSSMWIISTLNGKRWSRR